MLSPFKVVLVKPAKYGVDGWLEQYWRGFMPNGGLPLLRSLTPANCAGRDIAVSVIDEYVRTDTKYLDTIREADLLALVSAQSNQFQRACDIAAWAKERGVKLLVVGGPHVMTCDTSMLEGNGISFACAEAEAVWPTILHDAIVHGELQQLYGTEQRWMKELPTTVIIPPSSDEMRRYVMPMLGIEPARGCNRLCTFCSVPEVKGARLRQEPVSATIDSLRAAKRAGVKVVMFLSDNFNQIRETKDTAGAKTLLRAMIDADIDLPYFIQADAKIIEDPELLDLLRRSGCFQIFFGFESPDPVILKRVQKNQNFERSNHAIPVDYKELIRIVEREYRMTVHASNMIGFLEQDRNGILTHIEWLCTLNPSDSSWYVVSPVPGTPDYEYFLKHGYIVDSNLDHLDTFTPVLRHPSLSSQELIELRCEGYRRHYSGRKMWNDCFHSDTRFDSVVERMGVVYELFCRWMAFRRQHPMAGGVWRVRRQHVSQFLPFRRKVFDYEYFPLPDNRDVPATDKGLARRIVVRPPQDIRFAEAPSLPKFVTTS